MLKQYDETRIEEYGKVIIDVAEDAEISISGKLHLGYNIRKQSEAETYLKLHNKSKLYVSGEFKAFFHSSIEIFEGGILELGNSYINSGCIIAVSYTHLTLPTILRV